MDELQVLRTRVGEMAAEIERLNAVIDEANAHEPVATIDVHFDTSDYEPDEDRKLTYVVKGKKLEQLGIGKHNLYANPIPAQQSPSECDDQGFAIVEEALKRVSSGNLAEAPFPLTGDEAKCWLNGAASAYQHALEMIVPQQSPAVAVPDSKWSYGEDNDGWYVAINGDQVCYCMTQDRARYVCEQLNVAQQSPAVAGPDYKEEIFQLRQQAENWSTKLGFITSVINSRKISLSEKEREFPHLLIERLHTDSELLKQRSSPPAVAVPEKYVINTLEHTKSKIYKQGWNDAVDVMLTSKPSPRITEQDAREISINDFYEIVTSTALFLNVSENAKQHFWIAYYDRVGRALLAKLNATSQTPSSPAQQS